MKRLLLLVPFLVVTGCDQLGSTTPPRNAPSSTVRSEAIKAPAAGVSTAPSFTTDPPKDKAQDPPSRPPEMEERKEDPPEEAPPIPDSYKPLNKKKTVFFEKGADGIKRVHLLTEVCLREGQLEVFLTKLNTKEHEAILHVDADAREIHLALVAADAEPGSPAQFVPEFKAPTGTKIKVTVTFREKGKVKSIDAKEWVKDRVSNKSLAHDWVFAGSRFFKDPERKAPDYYMANNGELLSLSNFPDSMMDLPIKSSKDAADLVFEADTPKIPPVRTPVIVTLEPVVTKKK
ncbi:MAG TPA: YdjY domain-containing protein [Gemmataceae bacterium]|jgi:hypothetical protein|nr:YdjY domain-containing protein [Gemmataceae bacterium]